MAFLDFIRKFFPKKEEPRESVRLTGDEVGPWIETKSKEAEELLGKQLDQFRVMFLEKKQVVEEKMQALETAGLRNPDIPERAKHFMQGNRQEFSRRLRDYLTASEDAWPMQIDEIEPWLNVAQERTAELAKGIARPSAVLSEFLSQEVKDVARQLAGIEKLNDTLRKSTHLQEVQTLRALRSHVQDQDKQQQRLTQLEEELEEQQNKLAAKHNALEQQNKELERLEEDPQLGQLRNEIKKSVQQKRLLQNELRERFAPLDPVLKKYARQAMEHQELIAKYAEDPIVTLAEDFKLQLLDILKKAAVAVVNGDLELKDRKKERALAEINTLSVTYIREWQRKYGAACAKENILRSSIEQHPVLAQIEVYKNNITVAKEQIARLENEVGEKNKDVNKVKNAAQVDVKAELAKLGYAVEVVEKAD